MHSSKTTMLYIHSQGVTPQLSGGLNTTLLQVFSMCNSFAKAGMSVTLAMEGDSLFIVNINDFITNSFSDKILFKIVYWDRVCHNRLINRFLARRRIIKLATTVKADLIYTREPIILDRLLKLDAKIIFESHNTKLHNRYKVIHSFLKKKIIEISFASQFVCLISISESLSNYWRNEGADESKLFNWHDGFDISLFNNHLSKVEARRILNLKSDDKIVVYTGGLYPDREIENIIWLAKEFPSILFLVLGGPEQNRVYFERIVNENNLTNILFLGLIPHIKVPIYLYASDVLLALWSQKVPTINYCSPLKLFEYMASGRVILAHSFPTIKEVLTDRYNAILCDPGDINSLRSNLSIALKETDSNELGMNAREVAFRNYTWDNRALKIIEFIKNQS